MVGTGLDTFATSSVNGTKPQQNEYLYIMVITTSHIIILY